MIRVTVWNENIHDKEDGVRAVYPLGLHGTIAEFLGKLEGVQVRTATLDQPDCGLPESVLEETDVLIWWGHVAHDRVPDELAQRIVERVNRGMGFIGLHSAHMSKPLRKLLGTSCTLRWRDGEFERLWCTAPGHPIAQGLPPAFTLEQEEMYGEFFDIPQPETVVFTGWFRGGEVFRSGCCWTCGYGRVFYFQPGHETNGSFHNPYVQQIIGNAVRWAAPTARRNGLDCLFAQKSAEELTAQGEEVPAF
ncbi:MAG TPA: ThuA domain-containing protein [Firmicutes bacterium]|nr:ThuA domain-containing protein [Bacillota bacterium]